MESVSGSRARFEAKLSGLEGRRLTAVDYWDIRGFGSEPAQWDYGDWHHAVMGVGLGTDAGPVAVTWTSTFFCYGVEVFHDRIEDHLVLGEGGPERNGPHGSSWSPYLGTPVRRAASHWERVELGPARRSDGTVVEPARVVHVPAAIRLDFAAGPVWFVAAIPRPPDMRRVFPLGDEIMVVFSREKMRDLGFGDAAFLR
ncbi:hypothetical protein [Amycolatopsis sp. NPDC021455]|uniref:hypothetical protein n=1 Tax=Amycolatopsis sp. NPDC021455 TaxID=3154901 RepID=UPI0033CB7325